MRRKGRLKKGETVTLDDGRIIDGKAFLSPSMSAGDEDTAEQVFHSTVSDAAKPALQANMKQLYLTHISARYTEEGQRLMLEQQAQTIFPASKVVGDFDVFDI